MTLPGPEPIPVVYDVNVLVTAAVIGNSPYRSWPSPPPVSGNPAADCLGVVNDAAEFGLWLCPHVLANTDRVLRDVLKLDDADVDAYITILGQIAEASGGDTVDPPEVVSDCPDWEDNRVLDLAVECGALLVVSDDTDLLSMSPWRGTPILTSDQFVARVDGMRRHRRRR